MPGCRYGVVMFPPHAVLQVYDARAGVGTMYGVVMFPPHAVLQVYDARV